MPTGKFGCISMRLLVLYFIYYNLSTSGANETEKYKRFVVFKYVFLANSNFLVITVGKKKLTNLVSSTLLSPFIVVCDFMLLGIWFLATLP
jgi:hypothetical protein